VSDPCTVLIAAANVLDVLKRAAETDNQQEILAFTDTDALRALDVITKRKPAVIALERMFASTPRGAALINRIKADPSLVESEIRLVSPNSDPTRISAKGPAPAPAPAHGGGAATATAPTEVAPRAQPLDHYGTRRAPRFKVAGAVDVLVDGNTASLVDVSTVGAQVLTPTVLKPNQRIRMALPEDNGAIRFNAAVAWAKFEIPPQSGPRYRAGIEFIDANANALDAYCAKHKA
jgi:PilZ domain